MPRPGDAAAEQPDQSSQQAPDTSSSAEAQNLHSEPGSRKWVSQFGSWADIEAGVRLIEDRQNRRMIIKFDEKPSETVRALLKSEDYGYRFDPQDKAWYWNMNPAKPKQDREQAERLAFDVANIIREEKGLEQKKSFSLGA